MRTTASGSYRHTCLIAIAMTLAAAASARAQTPAAPDSAPAAAAAVADPPPPVKVKAPAPPPNAFERWVDLQTATYLGRYRYIETTAGVVTANQGQESGALKARLKFDREGRVSLNAAVATGNGFTSGWNASGIGTGDRVNSWYLKQIFVTAAPAKGVAASYGGFAPLRGESTEITSWDNDGYMLGERVTIKRPKDLYLDELSATMGYLGDTTTSSFSDRYHHLDDVNYHHLLAGKKLTKSIAASTDYTRLSGVGTMRAAVSAKVPFTVVDLIRYEQYWRMGSTSASGFAAYAEKGVSKRVTVGGGYADIDRYYGGLNGDRFNKGRRVYESGSVTLTRELSASVFATQAVHNAFAVTNKTRLDVVLSYNALATLKRYGLLH